MKRSLLVPKPHWKRLRAKPQPPKPRARINPVSKRRQRVNRERQAALVAAWGPRPWRCHFETYDRRGTLTTLAPSSCCGPVDGHEIWKRSRSRTDANLIDPSGIVPLCSHHNAWVELWPDAAQALGLADPSGRPTKSVARSVGQSQSAIVGSSQPTDGGTHGRTT